MGAYDRGVPTICLETTAPAPAEACFELCLTVEAHTASMQASGEQAVAGVTTGVMGLGDQVTWRARHFGVPFEMTSRITEHDHPARFVDEQVQGPFGRWWHEHRFEPADGGTLMVDVVEFHSPLGPLGRLVDRTFLSNYMTRLLRQRNQWIVEELSRRE